MKRTLMITIILSVICLFLNALWASPGDDALAKLKAGNERYVQSKLEHPNHSTEKRNELATGQHPYAIILSCSDSRVPPEIVFDQGLGDLFVIRVAGNVIDNIALGSIEYAAEHLHAPLIMVLGHERCGAVTAAVEGGHAPGHIHSIVTAIEPAVKKAAKASGDKVDNSIRENVKMVAKQLEESKPILNELIEAGKLKVVGARYDLDSGQVELIE